MVSYATHAEPPISSMIKCSTEEAMQYYIIRPMRQEDVPQVMQIDREVFPNEWTYRSQSAFRHDLSNPSIRYIVACALNKPPPSEGQGTRKASWFKRFLYLSRNDEAKDNIVGFSGFWMMLQEAHIIAIGVREAYRRLGIGEALLISTIELAASLNANIVTLEVRASNEIAQALYRKCGFQVVGKRLRYYSNNNEDGIIMSTDNLNSLSFQACFQQLKKAHRERHGEIVSLVP